MQQCNSTLCCGTCPKRHGETRETISSIFIIIHPYSIDFDMTVAATQRWKFVRRNWFKGVESETAYPVGHGPSPEL